MNIISISHIRMMDMLQMDCSTLPLILTDYRVRIKSKVEQVSVNTWVQKIVFNHLKNKITFKSYLILCKQVSDVKLNCYYYIEILETI